MVPPPSGPEHYAWKGEAASYDAKHLRLKVIRGNASTCVWGCEDASAYDWANLTGDYDDPYDYISMCRPCHRRYDDARRSMEAGFVKHPRGASQPGERNASARLTREIVQQCRERHAAGERVGALAREFGISSSGMSMAIRGKNWAVGSVERVTASTT